MILGGERSVIISKSNSFDGTTIKTPIGVIEGLRDAVKEGNIIQLNQLIHIAHQHKFMENDEIKNCFLFSTPLYIMSTGSNVLSSFSFSKKKSSLTSLDFKGNQPSLLKLSIHQNIPEIVRILLELIEHYKWVIPDESETILHEACKQGNLKIVELILDKLESEWSSLVNIHIDSQNEMGVTPMMVATVEGHSDVVSLLMKRNANPFLEDYKGHNVLFLATIYDRREVLWMLVNSGLDINMKSERLGTTPLIELVKRGKEEQVQYLVENLEADINQSDTNFCTPLHYAAVSGDLTMASLVIQLESNIDPVDVQGRTPLFTAVVNQKDLVVGYLISRHADITVIDKSGATISTVASGSTKLLVEELLNEYNQKVNSNFM